MYRNCKAYMIIETETNFEKKNKLFKLLLSSFRKVMLVSYKKKYINKLCWCTPIHKIYQINKLNLIVYFNTIYIPF